MEIIKKYKTISILITLVIVIGVFGFYIKGFRSSSKQNYQHKLSITSTKAPDAFLHAESFNLPSSFMGFSVSKIESDSSIETNALYYDYNSIPLSLSAWIARREDVGGEEYRKLSDLVRKFLDSEFINKSWSPEIIVYGKPLQPLTADGPGGRIWGYIKKENNKFQVVLIQEMNSSQKGQPVSNPTQDCPCNLEFRVFLSNIEDLGKFK